jgi:toxin ParE1/3/4
MALLRIRWTRLALQDLADSRAHLEREAPLAWTKMASRLRGALSQLRRHPGSGRVVPERRAQGYREIVLPPYRLVYAIESRELHVLHFWHARRNPDGL